MKKKIQLSPSMEAPKIFERIQSQTVSQGSDAHFRVRVVGKPDPECQWFKNGVQIERSDRIYWYWPEDNVCELVIRDVTAEDSATRNDYGVATSSASLSVEVYPPTIITPLRDAVTSEGQPTYFQCRVTGTVSWYSKDKEIKPSRFFRMTQFEDTYQLEIAEAYPEDEGIYTFVASNSVGQVSSTATLRLEGTMCSCTNGEGESSLTEVNVHLFFNVKYHFESGTGQDPKNCATRLICSIGIWRDISQNIPLPHILLCYVVYEFDPETRNTCRWHSAAMRGRGGGSSSPGPVISRNAKCMMSTF
uniref:Ig-like domain-containing protein n=1 Tax=Varanus komodoensis TaxID=61221 RepID=A0A8D2JJJ6_VARKO